jgi:hypothetical protein
VKIQYHKNKTYNGKIGKLAQRLPRGRWLLVFEDPEEQPLVVKERNLDRCLKDHRRDDKVTAMWLYCLEEHSTSERIILKLMDVVLPYRPAVYQNMPYEKKVPFLQKAVKEMTMWECASGRNDFLRRANEQEAQGGPLYGSTEARVPPPDENPTGTFE